MKSTDFSGFNNIANHRVECDKCGWTHWQIIQTQNSAKHPQYRYACQGCERLATKYIAKRKLIAAGINPDNVPYHHVKRDYKNCDVCSKEGAELHHWAPYAYFGNEAEKWPTSYLCQKCHVRWHQLVTPNISNKN